jgi:hypothetical protein
MRIISMEKSMGKNPVPFFSVENLIGIKLKLVHQFSSAECQNRKY